MGSFSDALETSVLNHVLGGATYTQVVTWRIALFTTGTTDATIGTEVGTARGYARVAYTNAAGWTMSGSNPRQAVNANTVTFGAPVTTNWGQVSYFGLCLSATIATDDAQIYGSVTNAPTINAGDGAPSFAPGSLVITLD